MTLGKTTRRTPGCVDVRRGEKSRQLRETKIGIYRRFNLSALVVAFGAAAFKRLNDVGRVAPRKFNGVGRAVPR